MRHQQTLGRGVGRPRPRRRERVLRALPTALHRQEDFRTGTGGAALGKTGPHQPLPGQVVETRTNSALGLVWGSGGSLRLDEDTRLEFIDEKTVFLYRGRVYFDSIHSDGSDSTSLVIKTSQGVVTHIGTQYMASIDGDELIVSVREG